MSYDEMNKFVINYLENDISGRAIMLTGDWGAGKSYYVKNCLKPFLEEESNHRCIIVSLYGLCDTSEISKAIYMELRTIKKSPTTEVGNTAKAVGKIIGKTIFNGLVSKIGFDIANISDEDLEKIYKSVDLTGNLIVLEDIERTKIDIIELLGFVNNMCENDGVKLLFVTNEDEILSYSEKIDKNGKRLKEYTESAWNYLRAKEKTVGDTVYFVNEHNETISQIISSFGFELNKYNNEEDIESIRFLFFALKCYNLRAFIYGCQKIKEILAFLYNNNLCANKEIEDKIFFGCIAFTLRKSKNSDLRFEENSYLSGSLGFNEQYPLFHFCYEYITFQMLSIDEIRKEIAYYLEYKKNGKWNSGQDTDLRIIKEFYNRTESEVIKAVANIPKKIKNGDIPYCDYGVLVNYLVAIKYEASVECNIDEIEKEILSSLRKSENIYFESMFSSGYELHTQEANNAFIDLKQKMKDAVQKTFPYFPTNVVEYYKQNKRQLQENIGSDGFARNLDLQRFIELLKECTSEQINTIRIMFIELYRGQHGNCLEDDVQAIKTLKKEIQMLENYSEYDKIQKMQIRWFLENLDDFINAFDKTQAT